MTWLRQNAREAIAELALVVLFAVYIAIHPRGFSTYVVTIWSNEGTLLGLAAIAQFFVVLVKGIDLSVGSVVALTNVVASFVFNASPASIALGMVAVLAVGAACGLVNGIAVVYGRVQPIVATLATGGIFSGIALLLRPTPGGRIDETMSDALTYAVAGIPVSAVILAVVLVVLLVLLRRTTVGLGLYGVGSSEQSAYMTGLRVNRLKLVAYSSSGFIAALAGIYVSMVTLTGDPNIAPSYTLNSIAAVVLGGVALSGGAGSPIGAVIGALILKTISSLMFFSGLPPLAQPFFEGLILATAIALGALGVFRVPQPA
ncbi:MAG: ABC transporter permease [Mesorhizobium sp.]|uniref:ABC transporter permease n=1 Tax=unclassified Mesorhizobium TaxID=325217 RepID=UPI000F7502E7|nr:MULTISPECIES: ABC transporter permease [unclassified Mesorhizobium]RVC70496.1 ABC transporter permease [Mesorhizobium sp. M00.F.Ca.ET.038.03.1.1]RVC82165.1 ABC transporter permease [Mesorhizobium sp. M2A.F.Ca.ET.046.02.1.1]AZO33934.1 ABC transporter permease [Mesorhizobium sp. M2A.F.Ca.ET.046.03.2.1]RWB47111.1 MAG: ABC transporter permease [Mesorhizobium sp.]RWE19984.1 MAG: ABC transporter permease [Mesorhizobium sp.]